MIGRCSSRPPRWRRTGGLQLRHPLGADVFRCSTHAPSLRSAPRVIYAYKLCTVGSQARVRRLSCQAGARKSHWAIPWIRVAGEGPSLGGQQSQVAIDVCFGCGSSACGRAAAGARAARALRGARAGGQHGRAALAIKVHPQNTEGSGSRFRPLRRLQEVALVASMENRFERCAAARHESGGLQDKS